MARERVEYRVAYDVRAFGQEIGTYELLLADPSSLEEAVSRLKVAARQRSGRFNWRIQKRAVVESPWEDVA